LPYYYYFLLIAVLSVALFTVFQWIKVLTDKRDLPFAPPLGRPSTAAIYSLTLGMSPLKKETAHQHWPTYIAGMGFHIGLFLALAWLPLHFFNIALPSFIISSSKGVIALGALFGVIILIKRVSLKKMRQLSTPDDYFSNLIVTVFQLLSVRTLDRPSEPALLMLWAGVMLFYIPFGKLRHAIYFVPTRILLGRYFGQRGTWPKPGRASQ